MPSSPGPTDYKRTLQRFFSRGFSIMPQDALPEGKMSWLRNMRSYEEGTLEVRYGLNALLDGALPDPIHTIFRLNDPTIFAGGNPSQRLLGAGDSLYAQAVNSSTAALVESGYSGDPLTIIDGNTFRSPRPFAYVADSNQLRKLDRDLTVYSWGIPTPTTAPAAELAAPQSTFLESVAPGVNWIGYGPNVTPAGALVPFVRINTTITQLLFDSGTTGMASVSVADFDNFTPGGTVTVTTLGVPQTVIVQSIHPPISPTTIAAILYDSGNTGLCSIQPTGGFSAGQIEAAGPAEVEARYKDISHLDDATPPRVTVTRTVDFPVDSLVLLGGVEVVRILSVAIGPDGLLSFRCSTTGTFAAGAAISGISSFRAYFTLTASVGDAVTEQAIQVTLTPTTAGDPDVGGFQTAITPSRDWGQVGNRATTPDDIIRLGFKCSLLGYVEFIRLMLDVAPFVSGVAAYEQDYYVYEWRAADLLAAIQATSEATTSSFTDGQATAVEKGQTQSIYTDQYAQGQVSASDPVVGTTDSGAPIRQPTTERGFLGHPHPTESRPRYKNLMERVRANVLRARDKAAKAAPVVAGASISRQLALGNDVWMTLECRVGDLTRVGTRTDLTLSAISDAAVYAQVRGTTQPIDLELSDPYLVGGYGPDVSLTLPPYVYRYSYRSTITGERSNPSPSMRAGMRPQRNRVMLTAPASASAQCDSVDWWRFGGALARWVYVGTAINDPSASPPVVTFDDDMADSQIDGGPSPRTDLFQPWPTVDQPRQGLCNVAGTSVEHVSGIGFDPTWSADTIIIINGRATSLYAPPESTTRCQVVDNCGAASNVIYQVPTPLLLAQPLPVVWGGLIADVEYHFACGDPQDPGNLHWANPNDPDSTSDANTLNVTTSAEPLQNGYLEDGNAYVFSTERLFRIVPTPGEISPFRAVETNCTKGLWSRWAMAVDPEGGCYFLAKDGIYFTAGGSDAQTVTQPDLAPLFPHDGSDPEAIRNLQPIDFTQPNRLRLSFVDGILYFDYVDIIGNGQTLLFEPKYKRWSYDVYLEDTSVDPPTSGGAVVRLSEPGLYVHDHLLAGSDGQLYQYTLDKITDVLTDINWAIWTPWAHGDDPRAWKQWGDAILDFNPGGSVQGISVTPVTDNGNVAWAEQIVGVGGQIRNTYLIEIGATDNPGYGVISRNCGLLIEGACQSCDIQRPIFYLWEPSFLWKGTSTAYRATDWEDLGYKGSKFIQGVVIRANTFGEQKLLNVQFDGPNGNPQTAMTLSLLHDGEQTIAYPISDDGWQPFVAELVRLQGADAVEWALLDWRFVFEPAPEAATQWETQDTTFDLPGFLTVRDGVMAYQADAPIELTVWHDQNDVTYSLPASASGDYERVYIPFGPYKGKSVKFQWYSELPFRLFKQDCSVRIQGWGIPGGYRVVSPFGGPSRIDGAGI